MVAAGRGTRFGGEGPKQYRTVGGVPVVLRAVRPFAAHPEVARIALVLPAADAASPPPFLARLPGDRLILVPGGAERADSVAAGLAALGEECRIVLVHDGVRPLVTPAIIEETIAGASLFGGCVAALPAKETTKRVDAEGFVVETVDRSALWSIQTPQTFRYEIFRKAVAKSVKDGFLGTDEAMLVERIGEKVKVVTGSTYNIKITTPEDMVIAEAMLKKTQARQS